MWEEGAGSSVQTGCVGDGWSRCHRLSLRCLSWGYQKLRGDRKCLLEMGVVRAVSSCSNSKNFPEEKKFFFKLSRQPWAVRSCGGGGGVCT